MTNLTFYGGVNEIGGNKFLLEDKGTKIFLDFGMQMGKVNQYFAEFLNPRKLSGFGDLFDNILKDEEKTLELLREVKDLIKKKFQNESDTNS